jgi:hypothetical protein
MEDFPDDGKPTKAVTKSMLICYKVLIIKTIKIIINIFIIKIDLLNY